MGYCLHCGQPTEGNSSVCSLCSSMSDSDSINQSSNTSNIANSENNLSNNYADMSNSDEDNSAEVQQSYMGMQTKRQKQDYWKSINCKIDISTSITMLQGNLNSINDFDLGELKNKFNLAAFFGGLSWFKFNVHYGVGIVIDIIFFAIMWKLLPILMPHLIILVWFILILSVNLIICIYLGINGNRLTYQTRPYKDFQHLKSNQGMWLLFSILLGFLKWFILFSSSYYVFLF